MFEDPDFQKIERYRADHWRELLTTTERHTLPQFVEEHREQIDYILLHQRKADQDREVVLGAQNELTT